MGRRFRRIHWMSQQVVKITRRFFQFCFLCGTVEQKGSTELVPVKKLLTKDYVGSEKSIPLCGHFIPDRDRPSSARDETQQPPIQTNRPTGGLLKNATTRINLIRHDTVVSQSFIPALSLADISSSDSSTDEDKGNFPSLGCSDNESKYQNQQLRLEYFVGDSWLNDYTRGWHVIESLSRGSFGCVEKVTFDNSDKTYVLKSCEENKSRREFAILVQCQSDFVAKLCASMVKSKDRFMFMKLYELGDLGHWLEMDKPRQIFREKTAVWITANLYAAINFIHGLGILHLDIKPSNILIDQNGFPVLADFGSARKLDHCQGPEACYALTAAYTCPEVLDGKHPDKMADLWAIGCCLYQIIKGVTPFAGKNAMETQLKISLGVSPDFSDMSALACSFLTCELSTARESRLGFHGGVSILVSHELFEDIDWDIIRYGSRQKDSPLLDILTTLTDKIKSTEDNRYEDSDMSLHSIDEYEYASDFESSEDEM